MPRPFRAPRIVGALALGLLLFVGACTTEFLTEGGSCEVDGDCEEGELCRGIAGAAGGESAGVCLRACTVDAECFGARDEICRLDPDGQSGVCGQVCVLDGDCPGSRVCRFAQCVDPAAVVDQGAIEPEVDSGPAPGDVGGDASPGDGMVDGASDAEAADVAPDMMPEEPDVTPGDMAVEADMAPEVEADMAPEVEADMAPEVEVDMAPEVEADMAPEPAEG